jgi:MurNAc alpha-1-phosphate uridylyltransferase
MNNGGGLAKGLKLLDRGPVFVTNADLFWIGERADRPSNLVRLAGFFDANRWTWRCCASTRRHDRPQRQERFQPCDAGKRLIALRAEGANPVVYAGAIAMHTSFLDDAPADAFNLNIYFDKAIARGRLYGMMLEGHWLTVGTPEAIGEAEDDPAIPGVGVGDERAAPAQGS